MVMTNNQRLSTAALGLALALGHVGWACAIDAQQTTKEAASSTGGQAASHEPGVTQLGTGCPSSTTAGPVGGSAEAAKRTGEADAAPCPPMGDGKAKAQPGQ
jgi:hypothetical protein